MSLHRFSVLLFFLLTALISTSAQPPLPVPNAPGMRDFETDIYTQHKLGTNGVTNADAWLGRSSVFAGVGANRILAAGAPTFRNRDSDIQTGAVVFYHQFNDRWDVKSVLTDTHNPSQPYGDSFGMAIALSGEATPALLAVSAPYKDISGVANAGVVYIYRYESENWIEETALVPPVLSDNLQFGSVLALTGTGDDATLLVGAPDDDPAGLNDAGSVYVYTRSGTTWSLQQQLTDGENRGGMRFGSAISAIGSGDEIAAIVGSEGDTVPDVYHGAATIFGRLGSVWLPQHRFESPIPQAGTHVTSVRTAAIIHNGMAHLALAAQAGVTVFIRSGLSWIEESHIEEYQIGKAVTFTVHGGNLYLITGSNFFTHVYRQTEDGWAAARIFPSFYDPGEYNLSIAANGETDLIIAVGVSGAILLNEPFTTLGFQTYDQNELTEDLEAFKEFWVVPYGLPYVTAFGIPDTATLTLTPDNNCDLGAGPGQPVTKWLDSSYGELFQAKAVDDAIIEGRHQCTISTLLWFQHSPSTFIGDSISLIVNDDDYPSLLVNGSFEQGLTGWTLRNKSLDKVKFASDDAYDDSYWMTFKTSARENAILQQVVNNFQGIDLTSGMKVRLQFYLRTIAGPYGKFKAKLVIIYSDGTQATKAVSSFIHSSGNQLTIMDAILASPNVANIKVVFQHTFREYIPGYQIRAYLDHVVLTLPDMGAVWRSSGQ